MAPTSKPDTRTARISVRVTKELHARCVAAASRAGRSFTSWIRHQLALVSANQPKVKRAAPKPARGKR